MTYSYALVMLNYGARSSVSNDENQQFNRDVWLHAVTFLSMIMDDKGDHPFIRDPCPRQCPSSFMREEIIHIYVSKYVKT